MQSYPESVHALGLTHMQSQDHAPQSIKNIASAKTLASKPIFGYFDYGSLPIADESFSPRDKCTFFASSMACRADGDKVRPLSQTA